MKANLKKVGAAAKAVIHDPKVERAARQLALLAVARGLLALGASAEVVSLIEKLSH